MVDALLDSALQTNIPDCSIEAYDNVNFNILMIDLIYSLGKLLLNLLMRNSNA